MIFEREQVDDLFSSIFVSFAPTVPCVCTIHLISWIDAHRITG